MAEKEDEFEEKAQELYQLMLSQKTEKQCIQLIKTALKVEANHSPLTGLSDKEKKYLIELSKYILHPTFHNIIDKLKVGGV